MELAWIVASGVSAAVWDARARRIPNWLSLGVAVTGMLLASGLPAEIRPARVLWGLGLMGASLLAYGFASVRGWLGWGDTKLMSAFASVGDPVFVANLAFWTGVSGAVLGLVQALPRLVWPLLLWNPVGHVVGAVRGEPLRLPYAFAVAAGAVLAWFLPVVGRGTW